MIAAKRYAELWRFGNEELQNRTHPRRIRPDGRMGRILHAGATLEIVAQGRVIRSVEAASAKAGKLRLQFDIPADASQWIAARVTAFNDAVAHTSPVYVLVDGATFADRSQLRGLVEKRLKVLDFVAERLRDPKFTRSYPPGEVDLFNASLDEARRLYLGKL